MFAISALPAAQTPYVFSTLAGVSSVGSADGTGAVARFRGSLGVAVDAAGNAYVTDLGNHTIRKISPTGIVSTLAGEPGVGGSADGAGPAARFSYPEGIAMDRMGALYVADSGNHTVRKIASDGTVSTLAGQAGVAGSADGIGSAARFNQPTGIAVDAQGTVYVTDTGNHTLRRILATGEVSTLAGLAGSPGDALGTGGEARLELPTAVAVDPAGQIWVATRGPQIDPRNWRGWIRKVSPAGVLTAADEFRYIFPLWSEVRGLAFDAAGNRYQTEANGVVRIAVEGEQTVWAGSRNMMLSMQVHADGVGEQAGFHRPEGVAVDAAGQVYVADSGNNTVRRIAPGRAVTTLAGLAWPLTLGRQDGVGAVARFAAPTRLRWAPGVGLYVEDAMALLPATGEYVPTVVRLVASDGTVSTTTESVAVVEAPVQDAAGNRYAADSTAHTILKTTPAGETILLAGASGLPGAEDGQGGSARFRNPTAVAVDASGNVFVADTDNDLIRHISPTGEVTTIGGLAEASGSADGFGDAARFSSPKGVALDASGNLYVSSATTLRVGRPGAIPQITRQPASQTAVVGAAVSFSVEASGLPEPSYQWLFNGTALAGSTASVLTVSAGAASVGQYTVEVKNAAGRVTSEPATLTLQSSPGGNPPPASSGGGGGAPSAWFLGSLALLAAVRGRLIRCRGRD